MFPLCASLLDISDSKSRLNNSGFRGFFNLSAILGGIFLLTKPISNYIDNGYFLEDSLYSTFQEDLLLCLLIWPLFFLWSFNAWFLQIWLRRGLHETLGSISQQGPQLGLFI